MASYQLDHRSPRPHELLEQFSISGKVAVVTPSPPRPPAPRPAVPDVPDGGPLDLRREEHRLRTLRAWPAKFLSPEVAARSGLYYFGDRDAVRCHFCGVELSQWKEGDDVEADHGRWSPSCPLLLRRPTENIPSGQDECGPLAGLAAPAHAAYMTEAARLASFSAWPVRMRQTPAALADAGFYYTGNGDQTVCYHCGGGLKDWEDEDEPWEQHALWFDRCSYVRAMKGDDFIRNVRGASCAAPAPRPPSPAPQRDAGKALASGVPASKAAVPAGSEEPREGSKVDSDRLCKICFNNEYNVCFVPCGHVLACMKCAMSVTNCPMCRKPHTGIVKLFYS